MPKVDIRIDDTALRQALGQVTVRLTNLKPILKDAGEAVLYSIIESFDSEIDPVDRSPWADLKPETIERKRKLGYANPEKKLIASGRGERAISLDYVGDTVRIT